PAGHAGPQSDEPDRVRPGAPRPRWRRLDRDAVRDPGLRRADVARRRRRAPRRTRIGDDARRGCRLPRDRSRRHDDGDRKTVIFGLTAHGPSMVASASMRTRALVVTFAVLVAVQARAENPFSCGSGTVSRIRFDKARTKIAFKGEFTPPAGFNPFTNGLSI